MDYIKQKLSLVPNKPGCYQMKNKDGVIIYVGKAKKLKNRLSSYFRGTHTGKTARLVNEIADFEYVVVSSEKESLILENNLIKQYDPKYNILLRDDKSYPYIELTDEKIPRLKIVRTLTKKTNNKLYGPYPNVTAARSTVNLLNRIYPLRKCEKMGKKPCLYYHIGQCLGYCTNNVEQEKIDAMKKDITTFLKGDYSLIVKKIEEEMYEQSNKLNFEKAKELKELKDYIELTLSKQKVEIREKTDIDVIGYFVDKDYLSIQIFFIRDGKIIERYSKIIPLIDNVDDVLTRYIIDIYENKFICPKELIVPDIFDNELLSNYLNINVKTPVKGEKKKLVDMACSNASLTLENEFEMLERDDNKTYKANQELKELLNMDKLYRIELFDNSHLFGTYSVSGMVVFKDGKKSKNDCSNASLTLENEFEMLERDDNKTYKANQELKELLNMDKLYRIELFDNSHLFGTYSVSGMVVFKDGKKSKNDYRKFKIKIDTNDEYSMMREVIYRRYFRVLKDNLERPDLLIVDGGIGQINIAKEIIDALGLNIKVVGLKKNDRHATEALITSDNKEVLIDKKSNVFFLLERMQDEVHNFTINYHKQIRSKGSLESVLDNIEGIGNIRKQELIKKYKTINKIKTLSLDELTTILPLKVAQNLIEFLKNY